MSAAEQCSRYAFRLGHNQPMSTAAAATAYHVPQPLLLHEYALSYHTACVTCTRHVKMQHCAAVAWYRCSRQGSCLRSTCLRAGPSMNPVATPQTAAATATVTAGCPHPVMSLFTCANVTTPALLRKPRRSLESTAGDSSSSSSTWSCITLADCTVVKLIRW